MPTLFSNRDTRADDTASGGAETLPFWTKAIHGSGDWSLASFGTLRQILAGPAAIFLGLQALGWSGYQGRPESAVHFGQSTPTLWVIRTMAGPVGAVLLIGAMIMAWFYPITRQRHARMRRLLMRRRRRNGQIQST